MMILLGRCPDRTRDKGRTFVLFCPVRTNDGTRDSGHRPFREVSCPVLSCPAPENTGGKWNANLPASSAFANFAAILLYDLDRGHARRYRYGMTSVRFQRGGTNNAWAPLSTLAHDTGCELGRCSVSHGGDLHRSRHRQLLIPPEIRRIPATSPDIPLSATRGASTSFVSENASSDSSTA
jgi:hypothetical protein